MNLENWGWNPERNADLPPGAPNVLRVIGRGRDRYLLTDGETSFGAEVSGAFAHRTWLPSDYPVAGDFVACRGERDRPVIEAVLPRRGVLSRAAAGEEHAEQVLATNVDTVFLTFALDGKRGFTPRLLERLLTIAANGGVTPVILLNKADLAADRLPYLEEARACAPDAEILCTSAATGENMDEFGKLLAPGKTHYFLGKSGAGKSSLINAAWGADLRKTGAVREADKRGRHVTSDRTLVLSPGGAVLIDAPGIREAALPADGGGLREAFPDIDDLARDCRFGDCGHAGEPGCAVRTALVEGYLDHRRYESYLEYRRETRRFRAGSRSRYRVDKAGKRVQNDGHRR